MSFVKRSGLWAGAMLAASITTAQAQDVTLNYSNWLPAGYALDVHVMEPWLAEIERVTAAHSPTWWSMSWRPAG